MLKALVVVRYRPAYGSSGLAPGHDLGHFAPHSYCPQVIPSAQDRPG
jgi:hypothetical protein